MRHGDQTIVYPRDVYVRDSPRRGGSNRQNDVDFERLENDLIEIFFCILKWKLSVILDPVFPERVSDNQICMQ